MDIIQPCSFAFVLLLIFSLSFAAKKETHLLVHSGSFSICNLRARGKKKQNLENLLSLARAHEKESEKRKQNWQKKKQNALLKFP